MSVERVGSNHPEVCQGNTGNGPCQYKREEGSQFCGLHGGAASSNARKTRELNNYKLSGLLAERANRIGDSSHIKSLADEIAMMRALLEATYSSIHSTQELLLYSDKLEKTAKLIGDLVEKWQKLQERNKELLGREDVLRIFDRILEEIIGQIGDNPDVIRVLADKGYAIITGGSGN